MLTEKSIDIKKYIFTVILIILLAVFQEVLLRIIFPIPEVVNFNRINYSSTFINIEENPEYVSNTAFIWKSDPDNAECTANLNIYGFRDKNWKIKKPPGYHRVMFIGDSFLEGFMASDEETIPMGFKNHANANKIKTEPLNLGVGASQFPEYLKLIREALPIFKPDYLFIIFYANDFPPPEFDPAWLNPSFTPKYYRPFEPRLYYIYKKLREKNTIPFRWRSSPFLFLKPTPDPSNPWSSEENVNRVKEFVAPNLITAMKKATFNPFVVNEYKTYRKRLRTPFNVSPHLLSLKSYANKFSSKLFIVYIPSRSQISDAYLSYQQNYTECKDVTSLMGKQYQLHRLILRRTCNRLNIPFFDVSPMLTQKEAEGQRMFWNYDEHMKGYTYLLIGKEICKWWISELRGEFHPRVRHSTISPEDAKNELNLNSDHGVFQSDADKTAPLKRPLSL